ncbi:zinc-binding dehydrogenase [Lactococcus garvieae]|uniref:zinc-binding dehydrogenase n=1 Tax=Lactococcus garvieae TaxID=1363 RepID=UPI0018D97172|nr:zinc-binding dehydrogenase [Lactococcus garvieae]QPS70595.1 zinc-binding dehydrogenase [Lactococcus garvieae]
MMNALYFEEFGDSSVLNYGKIPLPQVSTEEVLVKTAYIGLNFADIYRRRGGYYIEEHQPYINGYEASGEIVTGEHKGRKVLFVDVPFANAEYVAVPKDKLIYLPEAIDLKLAASIGLQGLTADFLAHDLGQNQAGDKVFVTGISGGVGQILSQILLADGMKVYGTASSIEKQELALSKGVSQVFPSRTDEWRQSLDIKFDTVYDGVGSTVNKNLDLLKNRGRLVFFGMAGGNPSDIDLVKMMSQSKSILTGDLWDFLTSFSEREVRSQRLFSYFAKGKIELAEATVFPLSDGKKAHEYLEAGKNIGKVLLKP